ncbi:restriction endonuclease subunit S [Vibrio crassostreae]|uniref:restriction endonuclease subunit S n=1 Tax=Vibrio crassostreae TaxID=246167 RepID=UPI001B317CA3|nr:restriction endonuclease subunit S [Vibrio crassostreae]
MVPNGWKSTRLNKIAETVTSGSRDWAQYYSESGSKFIRMTNLPRDGIYLKLDDLKYVNVHSNSSDGKRTSLKEGDLLISITAELGKIGWVPPALGEAYINQHTALVRIKKESAYSKYIAYLLSSHAMNHKINRLNDSGAKAGLNLPTIRSIPMVLPPLPEQRKIANILSTWDNAISTTERLIEASKQQKKALMQQLLTGKKRLVNPETSKAFEGEWEEVKLGDISTITRLAGAEYSDIWETKENGEIIALRGFNIGQNKLILRNLERIDNQLSLKLSRSRLSKNDIVFPCVGSIGKACLITEDGKFHINQNIAKITPSQNVIPLFLTFCLLSKRSEAQILQYNTSSSQPNVLVGNLRKFKFNVPSTSKEQEKIATVLTAADKEIEALEAKLAHFKQEKKALMQQLLTGKRRVKVDEMEVA